MATKPPYDLGPYDTSADAQTKCDEMTALGATCQVVSHGGKFWCRVTAEPGEEEG